MTESEVVKLMRSSKSSAEWDANCDLVYRRNGGRYPGFWYAAIILSGLADEMAAGWNIGASAASDLGSAEVEPA